MPILWIVPAVLVGLLLAWPLVRLVIALVYAPQIAARVLAEQPDAIHLEPASPRTWKDDPARERLAGAVAALGFADAGCFVVPELQGTRVQLLVHAAESACAAIYEHDARGQWFDYYVRFTDGTSSTWTTWPEMGLDERPGHALHHHPGAKPESLWSLVRRARGSAPPQPVSVADVAREFERVWAESTAWRKQRGISRREVVQVASRRAA